MNPVALLSMFAMLTVWAALGYAAIHVGAGLGLAFYILVLIAATNPGLWRLVGFGDKRERPR